MRKMPGIIERGQPKLTFSPVPMGSQVQAAAERAKAERRDDDAPESRMVEKGR